MKKQSQHTATLSIFFAIAILFGGARTTVRAEDPSAEPSPAATETSSPYVGNSDSPKTTATSSEPSKEQTGEKFTSETNDDEEVITAVESTPQNGSYAPVLTPVHSDGIIVIDSIEHLRDAINAAESGETLYLASDLTYDESIFQTIEVSKDITIDFGNYKISAIIDSRGGVALFNVNAGGSLTLVNAEIEGGTADAYDDIVGTNDGSVVIESTKGTGITTSNLVMNNNGALTIKNGLFNTAFNIVDESYGQIVVDSGTFHAEGGYGFDEVYGSLVINNAEIISYGPCIDVESFDSAKGHVEINGGTFTSISDSCISNWEGSVLLGGTSHFKTMDPSNPCFFIFDPSKATFEIMDHSFPSVDDWGSASNVTIYLKKVLEKITVPVKVEWVGPEKGPVDVVLVANGTELQRISLSEADGWQGSFSDVPKYEADDAHEIAYSVYGDPVDGYLAEVSGNTGNGFTVVYTRTGKISIPVTITWSGGIEDKAVVHLYADGQEIASSELNSSNAWRLTFADIEKYQDGKEKSFSVTEDYLPGYSTEITYSSEDGFLVKNTKKPAETLNASSGSQMQKKEVPPTSSSNVSSNASSGNPNTSDPIDIWIYLVIFIVAISVAGAVIPVLLKDMKD